MAKSSTTDLKGAILARSNNQRFPIIQMVRENTELASVLSKLHKTRELPGYNTSGNREPNNPDIFKLRNVATNTANNINDSELAMQMLPDLELGAQILISIVLSPKDMMTVEPGFTTVEDITSPELKGNLLNVIKSYFENKYDLKELLDSSLRDMLFDTGSYPVIVLPENTIDHAINGYTKFTLESFSSSFDRSGQIRNIGLLGPSTTSQPRSNKHTSGINLESFSFTPNKQSEIDNKLVINIDGKSFDTNIRVTDNPDFLKLPRIYEKIREDKHNDILLGENHILNFSLESELSKLKLNDRELTGLLFKERSSNYKPLDSLKTNEELDRMMLGDPLIMHVPSESVIPVYIPGSPDKHIGYFMLLDQDGNPLDLSSEKGNYKELSSRMDSSGSFPSAMLKKAKNTLTGFDCNNRDHLDYVSKVYGEMIEADLLARLRNGKYTNGVAIAHKDEIYRIMLSRSLSNRNTQVLWVPSSLMTYMAIRYNNNGVGKSLLEDLKINNSLRAMTNAANVMALLKNSIARTGVRIKFDENDPNPQKTLELAINEIVRGRQQTIPWGTINPADISDWFSRMGLDIVYEGHPGMPDVGFEFEDKTSNVAQPNTELTDELRKQTAMGLGLSPETIDSTLQPEFATSVITNNIMMSKRAIKIQEKFLPLVTDHVVKVIKNTPSLLNDLLNVLYDNFDSIELTPKLKQKVLGNDKLKMLVCKQTLKDFIEGLEVTLPKPDNVSLENQYNALETMDKILDKGLDSYINSQMFNEDTAGNMGMKADTIKAVLKAYYLRKWMIDNGVLPELADITSTYEDGDPNIDVYASQAKLFKSFISYFSKFMIDLREAKGRGDKILETLDVGGDTSTDYGSDTDNSDDYGSDDGGMDDFGGTDGIDDLEEDLSDDTTETEETSDNSTAEEESTDTTQDDQI